MAALQGLDMSLDDAIAARSPRGGGGGGGIRVARRVFVGNLSWQTSWQDLKDHFRQCGTVVHASVMEERPGRSKGCGIVEFESADEAALAIETLHDVELDGRPVQVREDREDRDLAPAKAPGGKRPAVQAPAWGEPRGGGGGGEIEVGRRVYVGNLSWGTSWQDLKDHFRPCGSVVHAKIMEEPGGRSKGCGIGRRAPRSPAKNPPSKKQRKAAQDADGDVIRVARRVYVGNLAWGTSWQDLRTTSASAGPSSTPRSWRSGRAAQGLGHRRVRGAGGAVAAIEQLNDSDLDGRPIQVREDREDRDLR
ncbi:RNA binding-protein [Aureococcus anophagefferens]|nr:RNA binding-protein [Aureococcus anophagefferens]